MRFEELSPGLLEKLGIEKEAEEVRRRILFQGAEIHRVSKNTSLERASQAARDVLLFSPAPMLLAVWFSMLLIRGVAARAAAARQLRRHRKVL